MGLIKVQISTPLQVNSTPNAIREAVLISIIIKTILEKNKGYTFEWNVTWVVCTYTSWGYLIVVEPCQSPQKVVLFDGERLDDVC